MMEELKWQSPSEGFVIRKSEMSTIHFRVSLDYLKDYPLLLKGSEASIHHLQPRRNDIAPKFIFSRRSKGKFGTEVGKNSAWQLLLDPNYIDPKDPKKTRYLSAFLYMTQSRRRKKDNALFFVDANYRISIKDPYNDIMDLHFKYSGIRRFTEEANVFGWEKFIEFDRLGNGSVTEEKGIEFRVRLTLFSDPIPQTEVQGMRDLLQPKELLMRPNKVNKANMASEKDVLVLNGKDETEEMLNGSGDHEDDEMQFRLDNQRKQAMARRVLQYRWNKGYVRDPDAFIVCTKTTSGRLDSIGFHKAIVAGKCLTIADYFAGMGDDALSNFICPNLNSNTVIHILSYCYGIREENAVPSLATAKTDAEVGSILDLWDAAMFLGYEGLDRAMRTSRVLLPLRKGLVEAVAVRFLLSEMVFRDNCDVGQRDFMEFLEGLNEGGPASTLFSDYATNMPYYFFLLCSPRAKVVLTQTLKSLRVMHNL